MLYCVTLLLEMPFLVEYSMKQFHIITPNHIYDTRLPLNYMVLSPSYYNTVQY